MQSGKRWLTQGRIYLYETRIVKGTLISNVLHGRVILIMCNLINLFIRWGLITKWLHIKLLTFRRYKEARSLESVLWINGKLLTPWELDMVFKYIIFMPSQFLLSASCQNTIWTLVIFACETHNLRCTAQTDTFYETRREMYSHVTSRMQICSNRTFCSH